MDRTDWLDLPASTRRAVEQHTGPVHAAVTVPSGLNSAFAARLDTERGAVFVKGLRSDYPRRWTQDMEAMINAHVSHVAPRMLWRVQGDWDLLGVEFADGRHPSYRPGSPDLSAIIRTITRLGAACCPNLPVKRVEQRWREYIRDPADLALLEGDRLLRTDYNPLNVLITGDRALLLDWARHTKGAGWMDPACLIQRLIAAGHTPHAAETAIADCPAWQAAPPDGIAAFARACAVSGTTSQLTTRPAGPRTWPKPPAPGPICAADQPPGKFLSRQASHLTVFDALSSVRTGRAAALRVVLGAGVMVVSSLVVCEVTRHRLGDEGLAEVAGCLWPVDCQTCGRFLGDAPPALFVDDLTVTAVASPHHQACRHPA